MKNKLLFPVLIMAVLIAGCNKLDDETASENSDNKGEIVFTGQAVDQVSLKSGQDVDYYAEYAKITINGIEYERDVFYIDEVPYTQAIKLSPGTYSVEQFLMYDDNQTPDDMSDDSLLYATPEYGSTYASFVTQTTPFSIEVEAFQKLEYLVEVLRFEARDWEEFGFDWFVIEESIIREQCFFGDLCVKSINDYVGSMYENQENGLQLDMPAIAKIEVYQNTSKDPGEGYVLTGTFNNESYFGEGAPLCVQYKDYNLYDDQFKFKLYILVADGENFSYKHFLTWEFDDDQVIENGTDGITDYVLGSCVPDADFIIPPYMNLPETATYKITASAPGDEGGYLDAMLTNVGGGYDIYDGTYASWCFDHQVTITVGQTYNMDVYSSLYPNLLPDYVNEEQWEKANWLMNHLHWYDGYEWYDIQGALWLLDNPQWNGNPNAGVPALSNMSFAQQMYDDANQYGEGYLPPPGGWAAVIFVPEGTDPNAQNPLIQTVFIVVDP